MDTEIKNLIQKEQQRQKDKLAMIPSENYVSSAILEAVGSILSNKYSEGYPGKRYYQGNEFIDEIETLAIKRAKELFNVPHVNVQPYSGSPANAEVYLALLEPGDTILGMALPFGGHLTHGHPLITLSGKLYNTVQYTTDKKGFIDYDQIRELALKHKPKIIISGTSAYPRKIDFGLIGEIADEIDAFHLADISHIAGLVAGAQHESPAPHAHIITTTTHKTLRGPRGAMIMVTEKGLQKDPELANKIDKAVFPGLQGGPHNNTTAGIAIALFEAQNDEFKEYARQIVANAQTLAEELTKSNYKLISEGTDTHLLLIDITNKDLDGWEAAWALDYGGIIVNRNTIPFDENSAYYPSGIRLGTPALTTRGMKETEMKRVAKWIDEIIKQAAKIKKESINRSSYLENLEKSEELTKIRDEIRELCADFPVGTD